jgi:hypothetical protein
MPVDQTDYHHGRQNADHHPKRVPAAETLAKNEEAKQLLRAMHAPSRITNPTSCIRNTKDRVEALRKPLGDV